MMELRPIPFISDDGFRVSREGCVRTRHERRGRSSRMSSIAWDPCAPMSLEEARKFARGRARDGGELVIPSREVRLTTPDGEILSRRTPTAVRRVRTVPSPPAGAELLIGEAMEAQGDVSSNWFLLSTSDGSLHLFHGPSVARAVFAGVDG